MVSLENQLSAALEAAENERQIQPFIKKNDILIVHAFNRAWNSYHCIPEFELGREFQADFLLLSVHSCHWIATFVELESPTARLYLKNGTPSKTLRIAQRQISDWKDWYRRNENYARQTFAQILRKHDEPAWCSHADRHQKGETEILDPQTVIETHFHIVIGRRAALTPEEQRRRAMESLCWGGPEIATYDRLVDCARRIDRSRQPAQPEDGRGR